MPTQVSIISMAKAPSMRSPVGLTPGVSSMTSIWLTLRPRPPRRCCVSEHCTESRRISSRPSIDAQYAKRAPGHYWTVSDTGWRRRCDPCPQRARRPASLCAFPLAALTRYVDDGQLEIDNSAAERSLRAVVLGRKNYLFMGSDSGGQRAAALYCLSAPLNSRT